MPGSGQMVFSNDQNPVSSPGPFYRHCSPEAEADAGRGEWARHAPVHGRGTRRPSRKGTGCWGGERAGGKKGRGRAARLLPPLRCKPGKTGTQGLRRRVGEGCSVFLKQEPRKIGPLENVRVHQDRPTLDPPPVDPRHFCMCHPGVVSISDKSRDGVSPTRATEPGSGQVKGLAGAQVCSDPGRAASGPEFHSSSGRWEARPHPRGLGGDRPADLWETRAQVACRKPKVAAGTCTRVGSLTPIYMVLPALSSGPGATVRAWSTKAAGLSGDQASWLAGDREVSWDVGFQS